MSKLIYLDNAATTKTAPEVQNVMEMHPAYMNWQARAKTLSPKEDSRSQMLFTPKKKKFILQQVEVKLTTGL